ncbi:hypothetical protein WICPIJ_008825 [Wickerhamomyces pijperi]|uniref:Initiator tRNA phosphoribosyl transferase n=1 Tax=Wickerhamomyces pijperi TaxID=599730 RepID=A0A9P8PWJ5_WICPI|nr:hypothetical protein WICPIJ_008825 [Wickerhamomyces pijperi]
MNHKDLEFLNVSSFKESIKDLNKELNKDKAQRSVRNRLRSIQHDAQYVTRIHDILTKEIGQDIPLIANERCGTWYVHPFPKDSLTKTNNQITTYFKSTDGHTNEWTFSFKRLNFHLLDVLSAHHQAGVMIVDSTRRGKTIPDALSKTIPIWCATLNYFMFGKPTLKVSGDDDKAINGKNWFFYPEKTLSLNEASKIADLIPQFAKQLQELNVISKETIKDQLQGKHLKPYWIHPQVRESPLPSFPYTDHIPLILCCSSERCQDGVKSMTGGWVYVQGAADDEELWSQGLNYKEFWSNREEFMNCESEESVIDLIKDIKSSGKGTTDSKSVDELTDITPTLSIGKIVADLSVSDLQDYDNVIILSKEFKAPPQENDKKNTNTIQHFPLQCNKKGSNDLRKSLSSIQFSHPQRTLILDESGKDLSIGVLLILLVKNYDLDWNITENPESANKTIIKQHLAKVNTKKVVNPSRATLQSVNSYLM